MAESGRGMWEGEKREGFGWPGRFEVTRPGRGILGGGGGGCVDFCASGWEKGRVGIVVAVVAAGGESSGSEEEDVSEMG